VKKEAEQALHLTSAAFWFLDVFRLSSNAVTRAHFDRLRSGILFHRLQ
jgi:hypothetical protein